ncbi:hypothetical protein A3K93_03715 [Acinetobacter sp. NCu2D-2]|uniref:META and DUF4377 domain-containing protein n=1 Tax=Acinetobacter sp. NCu2D-2 TaxID=1608473 RepID=UPI0007CDEA8D|nr:META and DUF4377 domain-containing protein [Acinetobacter sp. NCu2D-2]ANF81387.1 hypothetical protein A3K93_03715 [Acinetobacter sp. NCu2D-2]
MKIKYLILALLPLGLAACQSSDMQTFGDNVVTILQQQNPSKTLNAYDWHLDTGASKHMVLKFDNEGRFSVSTTCNTLGGSWKVESNQLVVGQLMSTMIGCNDQAMQQEKLAGQLFEQKAIPLFLDVKDANAPTLTLMSSNGQRYVFTGKMTPETKYQGQAETIFLEISPQTKSCTGVAAQTCLQVKEIKYNEQGLKTYQDQNWSLFYDTIEGYTHSPNERQIIRVKRYTIKNPAADQSKYAYVYDMAVEREAIKGSL